MTMVSCVLNWGYHKGFDGSPEIKINKHRKTVLVLKGRDGGEGEGKLIWRVYFLKDNLNMLYMYQFQKESTKKREIRPILKPVYSTWKVT